MLTEAILYHSVIFLITVWPDTLACGIIYGSSQHCEDPAPEGSFPQCLQCGELPFEISRHAEFAPVVLLEQ